MVSDVANHFVYCEDVNVGSALREYGLAALGALATLGASWAVIRAGRRDKLTDEVQEHGEDIAHIEGHLETKTGYRPRNK